MSAYIVNHETISVIVKGFVDYGVDYHDGQYRETPIIIDIRKLRRDIGQSLLNQNYESVNYRYREDTKTPVFEYIEPEEFNEGILEGCIRCYCYQACETPNFFGSEIHESLTSLRKWMLEHFIEQKGFDIPWGVERRD